MQWRCWSKLVSDAFLQLSSTDNEDEKEFLNLANVSVATQLHITRWFLLSAMNFANDFYFVLEQKPRVEFQFKCGTLDASYIPINVHTRALTFGDQKR